MEIGGHVRSLYRFRADDWFEAEVVISVDGKELKFEIPTGCDDPAQAIEFARDWLVNFGTNLAQEFSEKGSLE